MIKNTIAVAVSYLVDIQSRTNLNGIFIMVFGVYIYTFNVVYEMLRHHALFIQETEIVRQ